MSSIFTDSMLYQSIISSYMCNWLFDRYIKLGLCIHVHCVLGRMKNSTSAFIHTERAIRFFSTMKAALTLVMSTLRYLSSILRLQLSTIYFAPKDCQTPLWTFSFPTMLCQTELQAHRKSKYTLKMLIECDALTFKQPAVVCHFRHPNSRSPSTRRQVWMRFEASCSLTFRPPAKSTFQCITFVLSYITGRSTFESLLPLVSYIESCLYVAKSDNWS